MDVAAAGETGSAQITVCTGSKGVCMRVSVVV